MVRTNKLNFVEPKKLPTLDYLFDEFSLFFDSKCNASEKN